MKKLLSLLNQRHLRLVLSLLLLMSAFVAVRPLQVDAQSPNSVTCNSNNRGQRICWQNRQYECTAIDGNSWVDRGGCSCSNNSQCQVGCYDGRCAETCLAGSSLCLNKRPGSACQDSNPNTPLGRCDISSSSNLACTCTLTDTTYCGSQSVSTCIGKDQGSSCTMQTGKPGCCKKESTGSSCGCTPCGGGTPPTPPKATATPKPGQTPPPPPKATPTPPPPAMRCTVAARPIINGKPVAPKGVIRMMEGQKLTLRANTANVNGGKVSGVKFMISKPSALTPEWVALDTAAPFETTFTAKKVTKASRTTVKALVRFQNGGNKNICDTAVTVAVLPKICDAGCAPANPYSCGIDGKYKCMKVDNTNNYRCRDPKYPQSSTCTAATPSPTPKPPQEKCELCQYQVDAFWGPVIESFKGGQRYSQGITDENYRRLFSAVLDKGASPANVKCQLAPVQEKKIAVTLPSIGCELPIQSGKLKATAIDRSKAVSHGIATTTITNTSSSCTYDVGLASYKANWNNNLTYVSYDEIENQNLFDSEVVSIGPKESVTLTVKMPMNGITDSTIDTSACYAPLAR